MFRSRQEAGKLLGEKIANELPPVVQPETEHFVIGVGRGGILVAGQVAEKLKSPLSAFATGYIKSIEDPERDIAVVSSAGLVCYDKPHSFVRGEQSYLGQQVRQIAPKVRECQQLWLARAGLQAEPEVGGKRVIIVEDGIITDMSCQLAVMAAMQMGAAEIILAAPVVGRELMAQLGSISDRVVALFTLPQPKDINEFYEENHAIDDFEVIKTLAVAAQHFVCV